MLDDNWHTIGGDAATKIELLNATNQGNVLAGLITFLLAHRGPDGSAPAAMPDEKALCELHRAATLFLLAEPGNYRNIEVWIEDQDGNKTFTTIDWQAVPLVMQNFFRNLSSMWRTDDTAGVAAYALWRINWIHPFPNGNGRTARAFAYACLCLHMGVELPGTTTMVDQITLNRDEYQACLKVADTSHSETGIADLQPMKDFIVKMVNLQFASLSTA